MNREREREFKSERVTCAGGVPCPLIPILIGPIKAVLIRNGKKNKQNEINSRNPVQLGNAPPPHAHTKTAEIEIHTHRLS